MITVTYPKPPILGRIKTGTKSPKGYPMKLDYFMISNSSDTKGIPQWDPIWEKKLPEKPVELPVTVVTNKIQGENAIAFMYRVRWSKSHKMCMMVKEGTAIKYSYDPKGTLKEKVEVTCDPSTCPYAKKGECKINSTFHFILRDPLHPDIIPLGGHYIYASSSWNSINSLIGSLQEIKDLTGSLAMTSLLLRLREDFVEYSDSTGLHSSRIWTPYVIREFNPGQMKEEPSSNTEESPDIYSKELAEEVSEEVFEEIILPPEDEIDVVPF